ncbi:MAG TPA: tripartite tricarboxylate transporter substrate binding protein [Burkholderiales bacterium]|nr:tripartite tricarboxylate transporter substrate binding protein [Burkholderiales bacterium]
MRLVAIWALVLCIAATGGDAFAQTFPEKPVRVVIPYAPGGGTDNLVRIIAPSVGSALGQQLIIENRPGGSSIIGSELVAKAAPDGYTILATDLAFLVNPGLFKAKMPFDTVKSFSGLTMMASAPVILVIHPSVPAKNLAELLALARAKPGSLNFASGGYGASTHLAGELMNLAAKVSITHIPYKGTAPAMADLLAGQVHMQFAGISTARQYVEAGKLRAIAVTGKQRNPAMPDVPTFDESGLAGIDADTYWGVYAPAGVPAAALASLNKAFTAALRSPMHAERLAALGYLPIANSVPEHTQQFRDMVARWTDVIEKAKIQTE